MKWLIASDIHGSSFYCEKLLEAYRNEKADRLLLLGDILYHGPRNELPEKYAPKNVITMLNEIKNEIFCVRGNCDTEVDQMVLEFPIMAEYALIPMNGRVIFATHGHHFNLSSLPSLKKGDILLHGHTHVSMCDTSGDIIYLNPGSVSIPKSGTPHSYMILENNTFIWKDIFGNKYMESSL